MRKVPIVTTLSDSRVKAMKGTLLDDRHFTELIRGEDVDVLKPDGTPLLLFRYNVLPAAVCRQALPALRRAAKKTDNRAAVAGAKRVRTLKADGTYSAVSRAPEVESGVIGYYDRTGLIPYCRTTAFTGQDVKGWFDVLPFIRACDAAFHLFLPARYEAQMQVVRQTPPEFVIRRTCFSTVTVNRNLATRVHRDKGDLPEGFGVMSVLRSGTYSGGYLVFPKYRVAVDMGTRDLLLADVHEWHGNTAIIGKAGKYERISTVLYYRSRMRHCDAGIKGD
jgi:Oxygenase domain of the 2OGFeDO superfamily